MRTNLLKLRMVQSATLVVLMLSVLGMTNTFAQTQIATLQHGDDMSMFYGQNALVDAYSAAETGDIITLSSGTFTPCDITKAITLRGAGMKPNTLSGATPTIIAGSFNISIPTNNNAYLTMEGIRNDHQIKYSGDLSNPKFIRCQFNEIVCSFIQTSTITYTGRITNATFNNCIVTGTLQLSGNSNANCMNSIIWNPVCVSTTVSNFNFLNCIVYKFNPAEIYSSAFQNCIIMHFHMGDGSGNFGLPVSNTVYYCASTRGGEVFFNFSNGTNWQMVNCSDLFKTFDHDFSQSEQIIWSDSYSFELTEDAQSLYVGSDGKQIGIYGGNLPFSSRPSYMVVKRCNVANKSTIDGKLSVEIEVFTDEE